MKVGLICPYNMFRGGGVQECVFAMQAELKRRGHEVVIITPMPRENAEDARMEGVIFLGGGTQVKSFQTTSQVSASVNTEALQEMLETHDFDILHFHEPWVPMVSRQILTRSHSINVATFHAKLPDTIMSRTIERVITPYTKSILNYFDAFTAVSHPAAEYAHTLMDEPINIIPNGIDLKVYKPGSGKAAKEPFIFYVGRLEKRKGLKHLLKAFALVQEANPDIHLKIAGDGPDRLKLQEQAEELNLKNIEFLGYISQEQKLELLQTANVFCSPARHGESFGIVLLEAMACGTPIVSGDNPGYRAVMRERGARSVVSPERIQEFADRLLLFINDEKLRTIWRQWALDYVKQFDYATVVDQYEALYQELMDEA